MNDLKDIPHLIHGSADSLDVDVYFLVPKLGTFNENKQRCDKISADFGVNGNLIVVNPEIGNVSEVYKGTVDEVNNSILATYHLHDQCYPMPIESRMKRDVGLKWLRVIRGILSHCSRTQYRENVKSALRSDSIFDKVKAVSELDFTGISDFNKEPVAEVHKFISFQAAQIIGLMCDSEIYTKAEAAAFFDCEPITNMLYRKGKYGDAECLNILAYQLAVHLPNSIDFEHLRKTNGKILRSSFGDLDVKSEKYV